MSATILLKRTLGTSPPNIAPVGTGVSFGELVYTYDTSDVGAGKSYKKLYIGNPAGPTAAPIPIGGEYYTSLFNDNPSDYGKPQASKVLILDSQGRVASWTVVDDFYTAGVGTVAGDFTVGGNLNVTGDLQYDEANARLMAAAPELLTALEKLTALAAKQLDQSATHDGLENCKALADARKAIAKAKGGAE